MSRAARRQLNALTGLRFVAALWVVVYHYVTFFAPVNPAHASGLALAWQRILDGGPLGVDFFFLLSGFILAYSYTAASGELRGSRAGFWVARLARIYPVYLVGLALDAVPFLMRHHHAAGLAASAISQPLLIQAWLPFVIDAKSWNPPGWSLSNEAFFYLLFPFILVAVTRLDARKLALFALVSWAAFALLPLPLLALATRGGRPLPWWLEYVIAYDPLMRLPEFTGGMALGLLFLRQQARGGGRRFRLSGRAADALGLALIALVLALQIARPPLPYGYPVGALACPPLAALIYLIAQERGHLAHILAAPLSVWLGEISYGIYILHWPVWSWLALFAGQVLRLPASAPVPFAVYLAVLLAAAGWSYRAIERPLRRTIRLSWEARRLPWHLDGEGPRTVAGDGQVERASGVFGRLAAPGGWVAGVALHVHHRWAVGRRWVNRIHVQMVAVALRPRVAGPDHVPGAAGDGEGCGVGVAVPAEALESRPLGSLAAGDVLRERA